MDQGTADSRGADGLGQGSNNWLGVEPYLKFIVGESVTQAANEKQQRVPLIKATERQSGKKPEEILDDSGYCSDNNLKYLEKKEIEGFVATKKQKHGEKKEACKRGPLPQEASRVERMERKLKTKVGTAIYTRRK